MSQVQADPSDLKKLPVNARLRGKLRQIRRELDSQGGLKVHRVDKADRSVLEHFYQLESAGWKGTEGSAIACSPETRQFYDEISQTAERFGYLCMYSLELNGELLASHFGLSHKGRYFSPKIAYNEKFPQYVVRPMYDRWGTWADNVMSWVAMRQDRSRFLLLRYEDMVESPERELAKVVSLLKLDVAPEKLSRAVQLSGSDAASGKGAAQSLGHNQPDPRGQAFC